MATPGQGIRVISFDGPSLDVTGLSELLILEDIAGKWAWDRDDDDREGEDVRVSELCDIVGGTGIGGFYAILFSLNLTVGQVITSHKILQSILFSSDEWERQDSIGCVGVLKATLRQIVEEVGLEVDLDSPFLSKNSLKCFVCVLNNLNAGRARALRNYRVRSSKSPHCTIREAIHATLADAIRLPPTRTHDEQFICASSGFANPSYELMKELPAVFPKGSELACFINLGVGPSGLLRITSGGSWDELAKIVRNTEVVAQNLVGLCSGLGPCFFRLSAVTEVNDSAVNSADDAILVVKSHTVGYLEEAEVGMHLDAVVDILAKRHGIVSLERLGSLAAEDGKAKLNAQVEDVHDHVVNIKKSMDDEIYHKIKTWLMPIDQTAKLDSCIRTRSSSTCGWLWDSPRVVGWMKTGGIFWCHAGMGAGKTIIVSHVVETLMKTPEECFVAYYYFEFTNPSSLSEEALFRSLVSQLSHVNKVSSRHLYERHRNGSLQPQLATLQDTLHELVAAAPLPVYIIIDALDELPLPGRRYLIGSLLTLSSLPADRLRIMTTSRDELDIHKCFLGKVSLDFALEREMVHRDIVVFVDQELSVEKWKSWPEKEVLNARNILIDKADGMFRMVACQMEVLNQTQSTEDLRKALSSLPATLKDTYLYILNAIPSHLRTRAHTLLSVLCVSFEPVSVVELSELLAVDLGDPTDPDNLPVHCEGLRFHEPSNIMGLGMALVRQTRSWSIEFLQLSHASVKEYLLQDTCSWCAIDEELAHETTARTCLALLVLTENPRDTAKVRKITYSAKYWWRHIHSNHSVQLLSQQEILFKTFPWPRFSAGRSSKYRDSAFKDIVFFDSPLIFATGANLEQQLSKMLESSSQWPIDALNNAMHVAAQTGSSTKVLIALIKKGGDVNVTTSDGTSLLQASAHFNHLHVVRVLVEHGADVNKVGGKFSWVGGNCGSVLQAAASSGALGVVKFLVENGADMNMRGGVYGSALQAATREKDLDVVKLLVESGADVNMRGGKFGSALRAAVSVGAPDIIKFLVESGADVNMVVEQCGSALQLDADQMALRFATLFVESGADVNMVVERHGSVLQAAAGWGSLDVVKVLVENGADVNLKGGEYGSALHATAWRRSLDVVTFLVESGADVNTIGGKYGSILQEAAWGGNLAVLRFLVENGVDVNPGREVYGSALEAAKRSPLRFVDRLTMQEVMTFLVEKGAVRLDGTTPLSDELEDEESSIEYISGRS